MRDLYRKMQMVLLFNSLMLIFVLSGSLIGQEIPNKISFQGRLLENDVEVNGIRNFIFTIGSWTEAHNDVQVEGGLYSVILGSIIPIPETIFTENPNTELQIDVDGTTLEPNLEIVSSSYSFKSAKSGNSEKLDNKNPEYYLGIESINGQNGDSNREIKIQAGSNVNVSTLNNTITISATGGSSGITELNQGTGVVLSPNPITTTGTISVQNTTALWNANKIQGKTIANTSPTSGQFMKYNGTQWQPSIDNDNQILNISGNSLSISNGNSVDLPNGGGGTITQISTGIGLTGGPITTSGTIDAQNNTAIWNANKLQSRTLSTSAPSAGEVLKWSGSQWKPDADLSGSSLWLQNGNNIVFKKGNVGIGSNMDSPQFPFHVVASQNSLKLGVAHFTNTIHSVDAAAISGICSSTDNYGYGGYFTGGYCGVIGKVMEPTGSESYIGVIGRVENAVGGEAFGLYGRANNATTNYGVYGWAYGGTTNYAGYFRGDVNVTGTLSKSAGSFSIDHPLDPENKYLYHSFVESPDMMNIYNGNVMLDNDGKTIVELPEYFEALNMEFRYQLTCIGGYAPIYVEKEITGNSFSIAGGTSGMEVSWQVTGIRHDPYANNNRIIVEVEKPINERGLYLHYQDYNQPIEKSIEAIKSNALEEK